MAETAAAETFGFQAEVKQLLHLMVHSLYSNREIFLRELISNASDANDKLRFESIERPELLGDAASLKVTIELDKAKRTLAITDNGIGMSRDEIVEHLGTIAHSGTGGFLDRLTGDQRKDSQLIGQFGVGFYSAFIVAEEVTVQSRRADLASDQAIEWQSTGEGEYSIRTIEKTERGTSVRLKIKEDADEFLEEYRLRSLVNKYSDHIAFPIYLRVVKEDAADATDDATEDTTSDAAEEPVNRAKALWTRPRNEISDDEYTEFYRHITHDFTEPLSWSHNRVEGKREYTSLLYIPAAAQFDLWNRESPRGVKLYVQRVFITDQAAEFLPLYLRFVRGVVDSSDLSLNVSRELLQQDSRIGSIRSALTKRVIDMLSKLAKDDADKYSKFWAEFGAVMKEGLAEDPSNKQKIAELLRFSTTKSAGTAQDRSLANYLADAEPDQDKIYYLVAETPAIAAASPHLEAFRERNIEVLLLTERIDEWALQYLTEFDGKALKDVARGQLDFGENESVEPDKEQKDLLERIKKALDDQVNEVRSSGRLKESAACIVLNEQDVGHQMKEFLKAAGHDAPETKPNLEVNLSHPLLLRLATEEDETRFGKLSSLVFDQAVLAEGRALADPAGFVRRINELLFETPL